MRVLKVKISVYKVVFGERTLQREIISHVPSPAFQGENEIKTSLQQGYADLLGVPKGSIKVKLLQTIKVGGKPHV